jgi:hypothetical protein
MIGFILLWLSSIPLFPEAEENREQGVWGELDQWI